MLENFDLPEPSIPSEELLVKLATFKASELVREVLKFKQKRQKNGITTTEVCRRSRLQQTQVSRLENISEIPSVNLSARYIAAIEDCIKILESSGIEVQLCE